ncbi:MAG: hypothetical protein AAF544_01675 [Bacteroidota bacterium]
MKTSYFFLLLLLAPIACYAQSSELDFIRSQDLSFLIAGDTYEVREYDGTWVQRDRPAPIGYIGDNYKRLHFRWLSIEKSDEDPLIYEVSGKTKVGGNICTFTGQLRITSAMQSASEEDPDERIGTIFGTFYFKEKREERGTGEFRGQFWSHYWLPHGLDGPPIAAGGPDRSLYHDEVLVYNSLETYSPGFGNNQFTGTWTSYRSGREKEVAWVDYRFSFPTDLDVGASEFVPSEDYLNQGWESYFDAWVFSDNDRVRAEAQRVEMEEWWK